MVGQQPGNGVQQQWIYENLFEGLNADLKMDRNVVCKDTRLHPSTSSLQMFHPLFSLTMKQLSSGR